MPCTVTAFGVKIASSGHASVELNIVWEVIREWNACHAMAQKRVLLSPSSEENNDDHPGDLLIAFFLGSSESPTEGIETEIEDYLQSGKPTLIYFSEARVNLTETRSLRNRTQAELKMRFGAATVDSYGDEKEFRAKFARHLDETTCAHPYFKPGTSASMPIPASPSRGTLSTKARAILVEACDDFEAYIGRIKVGNVLKIQANGKQLVDSNDPAGIAPWECAFQELLTGDFIRDAGCNGQLFQISTKGFQFLKTMGKSPVGYIAELGGM
jgi:hypothetical protein